ncbi:MAG: RNA polymerase sigma factor RpoH [Gammaproteobacteria bacterium]|nr:RNA polymerase sigma factor RpoH [Gammaproteobacteria bacterium]
MQELANLSALPTSRDAFAAYLAEVRRIPLLTAEDEYRLAVRWRDDKDLDAARQLVLGHLRFVVHIARSYTGYGLPLSELVQEGIIGLMKAVRRYEPDRKVRLITFAVHWIRAEIHEFILRNWRMVRVATTKAQRKLFFRLRGMRDGERWINQDEAQAIAGELNVPVKEVFEMESRLLGHDVAIEPEQDEEAHLAPLAWLEAPNSDPAEALEQLDSQSLRLKQLESALERLDARSQDIIRRRWLVEGEKATLHELADKYQVSAERIRQIEQAAMRKMRQAIGVQ